MIIRKRERQRERERERKRVKNALFQIAILGEGNEIVKQCYIEIGNRFFPAARINEVEKIMGCLFYEV